MSRARIIEELHALYYTAANKGDSYDLLSFLQREVCTVSDLCLSIDEVPPADLIHSLNKLTIASNPD